MVELACYAPLLVLFVAAIISGQARVDCLPASRWRRQRQTLRGQPRSLAGPPRRTRLPLGLLR